MSDKVAVLGGGVTGLAASLSIKCPAFESESVPGGICSTYYLTANGSRYELLPPQEPAYRFERGGGHWIFGGAPEVIRFMESLTPMKAYKRRSAVYFSQRDLYVPYPIQNHLRYLPDVAETAVREMSAKHSGHPRTLGAWLDQTFGEKLSTLFFRPFHDRYLDGLTDEIAPQDVYKSPVDIEQVRAGASHESEPVGYNATFRYPEHGLGHLVNEMRMRSLAECDKRVTSIDTSRKVVEFSDGRGFPYDYLYSTLPLNHMMAIAGIDLGIAPDPFTSVLVLNVGGLAANKCPRHHWLYVPDSRSGFHRVGFYSNVDESFAPNHDQGARRVSLYIERAFKDSTQPSSQWIEDYATDVQSELRDWGFLTSVEVLDASWIDVAYTWSWVDSSWRDEAVRRLADVGIHQIGRYGRWHFQGIADSIAEGLALRA